MGLEVSVFKMMDMVASLISKQILEGGEELSRPNVPVDRGPKVGACLRHCQGDWVRMSKGKAGQRMSRMWWG